MKTHDLEVLSIVSDQQFLKHIVTTEVDRLIEQAIEGALSGFDWLETFAGRDPFSPLIHIRENMTASDAVRVLTGFHGDAADAVVRRSLSGIIRTTCLEEHCDNLLDAGFALLLHEIEIEMLTRGFDPVAFEAIAQDCASGTIPMIERRDHLEQSRWQSYFNSSPVPQAKVAS
ncbi:MAG: hypothetical protein GC159_16285 [Phycisphaera sp.]|nr:hypothetical protein [Phycisphaera sp.]